MKKPVIIMSGIVIFCFIIPVFISVLFYRGEALPGQSTKVKAIVDKVPEDSPYIKYYDVKHDTVHRIQIEEFLYGVLAMEMSADFSKEALKSQAIAARTYIMYKIENKMTAGHKGADICNDYSHCQAYASEKELKAIRGKQWLKKSYPIIKQAVDNTRGQVLKYDNKIILPLYFSTSSGMTENSGEVFMDQYPYLKSVSSPYEEESPKYYTENTIKKDDFIDIINKNCRGISIPKNISISKLKDTIKIVSRTTAGSVREVKIEDTLFTGLQIRTMFGLNSSNFEMEFSNKEVVFKVKGYGHGVGMSQWGAQGMAQKGFGYKEILEHYYTDTKISEIY